MKYLKEFTIIIAVSFLGETLKNFIPLPIPASIYGLMLMLLALKTKFIKLEWVNKTSKFLIDIMPLMFIPAAVGLINSWEMLSQIIIPVIITVIASTIIVMATSGRVTQYIIDLEKRNKL